MSRADMDTLDLEVRHDALVRHNDHIMELVRAFSESFNENGDLIADYWDVQNLLDIAHEEIALHDSDMYEPG